MRPVPVTMLLAILAGTATAQLHDPFPAVFELSQLLPENGGDGSLGFVVQGNAPEAFLGLGAAGIGDINADGFDDLAIGAPGLDIGGVVDAGEVYVIYGRPPTTRFPPVLQTGMLDGKIGFTIEGYPEPPYRSWYLRRFGSGTGAGLAPAGDINADGVDDFILSARGTGLAHEGSCFVFFGSTLPFPHRLSLAVIDGTNGFRIDGVDPQGYLGLQIDGGSDITGDGIDDVVLGSWVLPGAADESGTGGAYVIVGSSSPFPPRIAVDEINGENGFSIPGALENQWFADAISMAGDVNNDGIRDMIFGAPATNSTFGAAYLVYGRAEPFPPTLDIEPPDGESVSMFFDPTVPLGWLGHSVSAGGDLDADGIDDLVLSAPAGDVIFVVFGKNERFPARTDIGLLQPSAVFRIVDIQHNLRGEVVVTPDVNGDGVDDLLISNWSRNNGPGDVFVLFGRPDGFPEYIDISAFDGITGTRIVGFRDANRTDGVIATAGDINSDGVADIIISGAELTVNGLENAGEAYIIFGRHQPCPADFTGSSDPNDPTYGVRDGDADADDFFFLLDAFANADLDTCDLDHDNDCDADDFAAYLDIFSAGCQ